MAVRFDLADENYSSTVVPPSVLYTICCWFALDVDRNAISPIWNLDTSSGSVHNLDTTLSGTLMRFRFGGTNVGTTECALGEWHRSAVTVNGVNGSWYRATAAASALTVSSTAALPASTFNTLRIGQGVVNTNFLNGRVAAFKMWNAELTQAEVEAELAQYTPRRFTNLVRWHPFVNAETADYSGNANTLTGGTGAVTEDGPPIPWSGARPRLILPAAAAAVSKSGTDSATTTDIGSLAAASPAVDSAAVSETVSVTAPVTGADNASLAEIATIVSAITRTDAGVLTEVSSVALTAIESGTLTETTSLNIFVSSVVQSARNYQTNSTGGPVPALPLAPDPNHLVLSVVAVDKSSGSAILAPTGFTRHTEYFNTSASAAVASAIGVQSGNFSWTTARSAMFGVVETNIVGSNITSTAVYPNPPNENTVTSIAGDLGAAPNRGTVFAMVTVDTIYTAWGSDPTVYTPSFSNGYTVALNRMAGDSTILPGGAGFVLAKKDVTVGESTALTVAWADSPGTTPADQATLHMVLVAHSGAPTMLISAWLGLDAMVVDTTGSTNQQVRVGFSTSSSMTSPTWTSLVTPNAEGITRHTLPTLTAGAAYWYQVERGGTLLGTSQQFTAIPGTAATDFTFGFGSCRNESFGNGDATILSDFLTRSPALFVETGDFHYRDINTNDNALFRAAYDAIFTKSTLASVLRRIPTSYTWSDHDFCGDGSDGTATGMPAARAVYRERVPHTTLPGAGIYQTFRLGRVRFILLDGRSYRSPHANTDDAAKTMLGAEQKTWLQSLLSSPDTPLTFIVTEVPWVGGSGNVDHWGAYQTERTEIAGWITASDTEVAMLCGDAHMLAIDNGTNAAGGVHVWQAAPLNQTNSIKGGPYSGGTYTGGTGYGFVTVADNGTTITATYAGIKADGTTWNTDVVTAPSASISAVDIGTTIDTGQAAVITSATDTAEASEASASGIAQTASDSASVTEVALIVVTASVVDNGVLSETASVNTGSTPSATDTGALTDTSATAAAAVTQDTIALAEASSISLASTDAGAAVDTGQVAVVSTVGDTGTLTEVSGIRQAASDSGTVSDVPVIAAAASAADAVVLSEAGTVNTGSSPSASDIAALTDTATLAVNTVGLDTGTVTDVGTASAVRSAADTAALSESAIVATPNLFASSDTAALAESVQISVAIGTADSAAVADSANVIMPTVEAPVAVTRGWDSLISILKEVRSPSRRDRVLVACPNDGEPLRTTPGGIVYCPFDGWRPE